MTDHSGGTAQAPEPRRHEFGAEVGRLLDLVVHSLYSEREIFLRELVANAADAIDRRRFEALTHPALAAARGRQGPHRAGPGRPARSRIADDGIGMTPRGADRQSRHHRPLRHPRLRRDAGGSAKPEDRPEPDRPVRRRLLLRLHGGRARRGHLPPRRQRGGLDLGLRRRAAISPWRRPRATTPGTDVVLHIKADAEEYLEPVRLETIVRKWADHVTVPITIARDGKDVPANEGTALWRKPKAEVTEQQYDEFYRHLGHLFDKPWATLHWRAEGTLEFFALLFIPGSAAVRAGRGRAQSPACGCMCGACSSPTTPSCCRPGCASCRAWSIPRTCRSTSRARCCRRRRCWPASAARCTNRVLTELKTQRQGRRRLRERSGRISARC